MMDNSQMKKPDRGNLPRYAIRNAIIEIRQEVAHHMCAWPQAHAYICFACNRVSSKPHWNPDMRAAVGYVKSYVQYALGGPNVSLEAWQHKRGLQHVGCCPPANDTRIAWLTWMLEGIEREIEEKGWI